MGVAKYTDTAKALKEWAVEMVESTLPKHQNLDQIQALLVRHQRLWKTPQLIQRWLPSHVT